MVVYNNRVHREGLEDWKSRMTIWSEQQAQAPGAAMGKPVWICSDHGVSWAKSQVASSDVCIQYSFLTGLIVLLNDCNCPLAIRSSGIRQVRQMILSLLY